MLIMKKLSFLMKWRRTVTSTLTIVFLCTAIFATGKSQTAEAQGIVPTTVTVWIQVTDSCKHALPYATFQVIGPDINTTTTPTNGTKPKGLSSHMCPIQQGKCKNFSTGCTSTVLNVPASGTTIYTITVAQTAPGRAQTGRDNYGANWTYAICEGGSDCSKPEVATVLVTSSGTVSATVLNTYPDGQTVTWPLFKEAYSGTPSDPIMFHEFGISKTSDKHSQCDGDHDADDYLTGTPGQHCESDRDTD
jgi:hypothetical protein